MKNAMMNLRTVDAGAVIGSIDCPHCGHEHLTLNIRLGTLGVHCEGAPGVAIVNITSIMQDGRSVTRLSDITPES
jgi:hypothetical protein